MNNFVDMFDSLGRMANDTGAPDYIYTRLNEECVNAIKKIAVTFVQKDLFGGFQYTAYFKNGYGIDAVKHNGSYGREDDLWEIAVMKDGHCCYSTPITDDVIGWLSPDEVVNYAKQIAALPEEKDELNEQNETDEDSFIKSYKELTAALKAEVARDIEKERRNYR